MIEAFGMAKQRLSVPIRYILTGNIEESSHPDQIRDIIKKYDMEESVDFVGYLSQKNIKEYLSKASLVISNRPKSMQDFYGFSTKVGEYLASGTPLITTNWGEVVNWLQDGKNAYIIEPENLIALSDTIVKVFENQKDALRVGQNRQELCQRCFDYKIWSKSISDFMKQFNENFKNNLKPYHNPLT